MAAPAGSAKMSIVMTRAGFPLAVLTSLAVAGCVHTDFTRTGAMALPARAPDCHLVRLKFPTVLVHPKISSTRFRIL
jgi:hypothetical protein